MNSLSNTPSHHPIHLRVRAVIQQQGHLLVAHHKGASYFCLPGGHLEPGEALAQAVERECREEMECSLVEVGPLVALYEGAYKKKERLCHELCYLFLVRAEWDGYEKLCPPISREEGISFSWKAISSLENSAFLPRNLAPFLSNEIKKNQKFLFLSDMGVDLEEK